MKKSLFILILMFLFPLVTIHLYGQTPQGISYQAVIRNNNGEVLSNQQVAIKVSFLEGSTSGNAIYIETHVLSTNEFGLVNIVLGRGETQSGAFDDINWAANQYFNKIEIDIDGGTNYVEAGISEILSVPYALNAKTAETADYNNLTNKPALSINGNELSLSPGNTVVLPASSSGSSMYSTMTNAEWEAIEEPIVGQLISITDRQDKLLHFNGEIWTNVLEDNEPISFNANAGPDIFVCDDTIATLQAELPDGLRGKWDDETLGYLDGKLSDPLNPNSTISGNIGLSINMEWEINGMDAEGFPISPARDQTLVTFATTPKVELEPEYVNTGSLSYMQTKYYWSLPYRFSNIPNQKGKWEILSGNNGYFNSSELIGIPGEIYQLAYSLDNICGEMASDTTNIYFLPVDAYDGDVHNMNEINTYGLCYSTNASPLYYNSTGRWEQTFGAGNSTFSDINSNTTTITVDAFGYYNFMWIVTFNGIEYQSSLSATFNAVYAGEDQIISDGSTTTNLHVLWNGSWSIISGEGGSIEEVYIDEYNKYMSLSGSANTTYVLRYTVTTDCGEFFDEVTISFN